MHIFVGFMQRRDYEPCHFWDGSYCDISWLLLFTNCCHGELRFNCCRVPGSVLGHVYFFCVFQSLVSGNFHFISAKFNIYLPYRRTCNSLWNCILPALLMMSFVWPVVMHPLWIIIKFPLFYPSTAIDLAFHGIYFFKNNSTYSLNFYCLMYFKPTSQFNMQI